LFGERFVGMSHLLPNITLAMALLAILYNIVMYGLALRAKVLGYALPLGAVLVMILNIFHHSTVQDIIFNLTISTLAIIGILVFVYAKGVLHTWYDKKA